MRSNKRTNVWASEWVNEWVNEWASGCAHIIHMWLESSDCLFEFVLIWKVYEFVCGCASEWMSWQVPTTNCLYTWVCMCVCLCARLYQYVCTRLVHLSFAAQSSAMCITFSFTLIAHVLFSYNIYSLVPLVFMHNISPPIRSHCSRFIWHEIPLQLEIWNAVY